MRSTIVTLAAGIALAGCSREGKTYSADCATPLSHWGTEKDGVGHLVTVMSVFLMSDGTTLWNSDAVSDTKLRHLMKEASTLKPIPQIVLQVSPAAACRRVDEVRAIMNSASMCRGEYSRCSEGWKPEEWPITGGP
jgi:hypothetical protein